LGPVEAVHEGSRVDLGGPRHRRLLAVLLLHAGRVVPLGVLTDALWGEAPPASAPAMLHVRVSELRSVLRPLGVDLVHDRGGYLLRVDADQVDARRFERLAADGAAALAAGEAARARADLDAALALWRGGALVEFAEAPFAQAEIASLEELRLRALENHLAAGLELGLHGDLVGRLEALVAEFPFRERFWAQLMVALYRAGRQAEAVHAYQRVRALMADDLGLDPGVELQRLHKAILRQDRELDRTAPGRLWALSEELAGRQAGQTT
jgi:DNA-binding SARP family transcriptional activator